VPNDWESAVFHDLRAEGAFLVSAERKDGKTAWVRVKSLAGEPCKILSHMKGKVNMLKNGKVTTVAPAADGHIEIALKQGEEAVLFSGSKVPPLIVVPITVSPEKANPWGLKQKM